MDDCNSDSNVTVTMKSQETIATSNPEARQDLIREAEVDPLNAEQTWPTEEEMREVEEGIYIISIFFLRNTETVGDISLIYLCRSVEEKETHKKSSKRNVRVSSCLDIRQ